MQLLELTHTHIHTLTRTLTHAYVYLCMYATSGVDTHTLTRAQTRTHAHVCIYTLQNHLLCNTTIQQCVCHELMFDTHTPVSAACISVL